MVVICESADAAKYSGMGGIGKTLTAKWFAHQYEQNYDRIIWIDSGEGGLLQCFQKLAMELKVDNWDNYVNVEDFARRSFENLSDFKCLWIYDNAECYKGTDGILKVLPRCQEKFHCLITSRSRDWEDSGAYGKLSTFELNIFHEEESLEFLSGNLNQEIITTEHNLKELCSMLGNLPLALQLAVSTLNCGKINLQNYIEKTTVQDVERIVEAHFDDYEKTINRNIKITLEMIMKECDGKLAKKILMVFGYIRPDDIDLEFVKQIFYFEDIENSIELLIKYSLISRDIKESADSLSIHRLLQQVIRHNGKDTEIKTLRKILGCKGFSEYKITPFIQYADDKLRKKLPKLQAKLINQRKLTEIFNGRRYDECVRLANAIWQELQTSTTKLNHAVCLEKSGQKDACVKILKSLVESFTVKDTPNNDMSRTLEKVLHYMKTKELQIQIQEEELVLMDTDTNPDETDILNFSFYAYLRMGDIDEALAMVPQIGDGPHLNKILAKMLQEKMYEDCCQLSKLIYEELNTNTTKFNFAICLDKNGQLEDSLEILEQLYIELIREEGRFEEDAVDMGIIDLTEVVSKDLIGGHLLIDHWRLSNTTKLVDILKKRKLFKIVYSTEFLGFVFQIVYSGFISSNYSLIASNSFIELELYGDTVNIELYNCSLDLSSFLQLCPEKLKLIEVSFTKNRKQLDAEVILNDFLDFGKINRLILNYSKNHNISIDLTGGISMEYCRLRDVKLVDWQQANWDIRELTLEFIPFVEQSKMKIKELYIHYSSLNISCLPETLEKLTLRGTEAYCGENINLPNLKYLALENMSNSFSLSYFRSVPITHVHFEEMEEVNLILLPKMVKNIKITKYHNRITATKIVGGRKKLDRLILEDFSFEQVEEYVSHFETKNLVISYIIEPPELTELVKKGIKTIAVGRIHWGEKKFESLRSLLDRKANYYLLEGGKGRGINEEEFQKLRDLLSANKYPDLYLDLDSFQTQEDYQSESSDYDIDDEELEEYRVFLSAIKKPDLNFDVSKIQGGYQSEFSGYDVEKELDKFSLFLKVDADEKQKLALAMVPKILQALIMGKFGQTEECLKTLNNLEKILTKREMPQTDISRTLDKMLQYIKDNELQIKINLVEDIGEESDEDDNKFDVMKEGQIEVYTAIYLFLVYLQLGKIDKALTITNQITNDTPIAIIIFKMLQAKMFMESVQISKLVNEELRTTKTKFHYAICLEKNGQTDECVEILKHHVESFTKRKAADNDFSKTLEEMLHFIKIYELRINIPHHKLVVTDLVNEPKENEIMNFLFYSFLRMGNIDDALTMVDKMENVSQITAIVSHLGQGKMFKECVEVSKLINEDLMTTTSTFNYAVCLQKNGQTEDSVKTLENLAELFSTNEATENDLSRGLQKVLEYIKENTIQIKIEERWECLDLNEEPSEKKVVEFLYCLYLQMGNINKALTMVKQIADDNHIAKILLALLQENMLKESVQVSKLIDEEVKTTSTRFNYASCLDRNGQLEDTIVVLEDLYTYSTSEEGKYTVEMRLLATTQFCPKELIGGHLLLAHWRFGNKNRAKEILETGNQMQAIYTSESLDILFQICGGLIGSNYYITNENNEFINFKLIDAFQKIELMDMSLCLSPPNRLSAKEVQLSDVSFSGNGLKLENDTVNGFLDLDTIIRLAIKSQKKNIAIDLSHGITMDYVYLKNVRVLAWGQSDWNIDKLKLKGMPFKEMTKMNIKELHFSESSIDISCVPKTVQKLILAVSGTICDGIIDLPYLQYLKLNFNPTFPLLKSTHLSEINLYGQIVDIDLLPQSLRQLKMTYFGTKIFGGVRKLEKLILKRFPFKDVVEIILNHFQTDILVLSDDFNFDDWVTGVPINPIALVLLLRKQIKMIVVGRVSWDLEDFEPFTRYLDRKAAYYILEGGQGRGIDEKEFRELRNG